MSLRVVLFTFLLSLITPAYAEDRPALDEMVALLENARDMQGEFVQLVVDGRGTRVQETRGAFKALKPNFFYWETREPLPQSIYIYNDEITVFDPDLEQASVQPLSEDLSATPALLFNGSRDDIARRFVVEKRLSDESESQFLLFPIDDGNLFEVMRVRFENGRLSDLRISDSLGQDTTISFIQSSINSGLTPDDFKPDLPEGIDIIRQE